MTAAFGTWRAGMFFLAIVASLLLVVRPGAPSSVVVLSSKARSP